MIEIQKDTRYRAMCTRCRRLSRWHWSAQSASVELDGHRCEVDS